MISKDINILIVEDTLAARTIISNILLGDGFKNITEASDGALAWKEIQAAKKQDKYFDLLLVDWNMPNMNGLELLKKLRLDSDQKLSKTPFLMLTSITEKDKIMAAIAAGANNYLSKPFTSDMVLDKLTSTLNLLKK
jgi:two-component system chemotaxis response regulator CheY